MPRRSAASMAGSIPAGFHGVEAVIDEIEDEWRRAKRGGGERLLDFQFTYAGRFVEKHAPRFWQGVRELEAPAPAALTLAARLYDVYRQWNAAWQRQAFLKWGYVRPENLPTPAQRRQLAQATHEALMRRRYGDAG